MFFFFFFMFFFFMFFFFLMSQPTFCFDPKLICPTSLLLLLTSLRLLLL
jgi:hypothetical protein